MTGPDGFASPPGSERPDAPLYDPYVLGHGAARPRPPSAGWRIAGIAGALLVLNAGVALLVWSLGAVRPERTLGDSAAPTGPRVDRPVYEPAPPTTPPRTGEPLEPSSRVKHPSVPATTTVTTVGSLDVVDLGISEPSLQDALRHQQNDAIQHHETLLVMLTGAGCAPCDGVAAALPDARMQKALAGVRFVRVDLDVFAEELDRLALPHDVYPGFFLLDRELRPMDGIHGGEWDEDVAENIAPVLGAFVRGTYRIRRNEWGPSSGGIRL